MEIINEILIMMNTGFLVMFSDFIVINHRNPSIDYMVNDVEYKYHVGWYNLGGLACIFFFNIGTIIFFSIRDTISRLKKRFAKKSQTAKPS